MALILLSLSVLANITANILFKRAMAQTPGGFDLGTLQTVIFNPSFWLGGFSAGMVLVFYLLALRQNGLAGSYAFATSFSLVGITIASAVFFKEPLSIQSVAGAALVVAGMFLISTATHTPTDASETPPSLSQLAH